MASRLVWLVCAVLWVGCASDGGENESAESHRVVAQLLDSTSAAVPAPAADSATAFSLGRLGAATRVGELIAVIDMMPPHIKVYDATGRGVAAFLTSGEGPGQMRMPVAIATWDDSTMVVADVTGRFAMWSASGTLIRESAGIPGLPVMAMGRCGDDLIVYGPAADSTATDAPEWVWLRSLKADLTTVGSRGLREAMVPGEVHGVGGKVYGFAVTTDSLISLRHQYGPAPSVRQVRCGDLGQSESLLDLPAAARFPRSMSGATNVAPPKITEPRPAGLAVESGTLVLADLILGDGPATPDSTRFIVMAAGRVDSIVVGGRHQLLGGDDRAVLILESEPRQVVRVVRTAPR